MNGERHSPTQITRKLRTADQLPNQGQSFAVFVVSWVVATTCYHWQQLYGGMKANEDQRLKELEQEKIRHMPYLRM